MKIFTDEVSIGKVSKSTRTFCFVLFCLFVCLLFFFVYFFKKFYHFFSTEIFPDDEVFLYSDICIQLIISPSVGSRNLDTYMKLRSRIYKICRVISNSLYKPKYGSIRSRAPDSCCNPSVRLRIARVSLEDRALENGVNEGYSYSYDLEIVAGLYLERRMIEIIMIYR